MESLGRQVSVKRKKPKISGIQKEAAVLASAAHIPKRGCQVGRLVVTKRNTQPNKAKGRQLTFQVREKDSCFGCKVGLDQWFSNWLRFGITRELKSNWVPLQTCQGSTSEVKPRKTIIKKLNNLARTTLTKHSSNSETNWHHVPHNVKERNITSLLQLSC